MTTQTFHAKNVSDTFTAPALQDDDPEWVAAHTPKIENWYAVQVHTGAEDRVCNRLEDKGLSIYVPTCRPIGEARPIRLLPGYVLTHIEADLNVFAEVRNTPHVISILGPSHEPLPIPDAEVAWIRTMAAHKSAEPSGAVEGDWVRVVRGPMSAIGVEGRVMKVKGVLRLTVEITILGRGVSVEIDRHDVEVVRPRKS